MSPDGRPVGTPRHNQAPSKSRTCLDLSKRSGRRLRRLVEVPFRYLPQVVLVWHLVSSATHDMLLRLGHLF